MNSQIRESYDCYFYDLPILESITTAVAVFSWTEIVLSLYNNIIYANFINPTDTIRLFYHQSLCLIYFRCVPHCIFIMQQSFTNKIIKVKSHVNAFLKSILLQKKFLRFRDLRSTCKLHKRTLRGMVKPVALLTHWFSNHRFER